MKRYLRCNGALLAGFVAMAAAGTAHAQHLREGYVDWGPRGQEFCSKIGSWEKGQKWSEDDNFFISRVKPKARFRSAATQVRPDLNEANDKKLIFWVPINNQTYNALPDGVYDSEVFPMWSYVTHYGNWSTSLCRIPGNFLDVAHKNGVPVSPVAGVPWGNISEAWATALDQLAGSKEKVGDYLEYYGIDGLGYNSEFNGKASTVAALRDMHSYLVKRFKTSGQNPLFENIWYDGTNDTGTIQFDAGLYTHNDDNWGYGDDERSALFFNYNWNKTTLLDKCVTHAEKLGRTPLDLYCGFNMQGREPKSGPRWSLLKDYPLSIGLWGAHSMNMFFESRGEKGSHPDARQRTYMLRMERWFTGGLRNPANCPEIGNSLKCCVDNEQFNGMSSMMTARSSLCWDLATEPFITAFNLGNGKFLNWQGRRMHDKEWYNIGVQDYLPTWHWWWSTKLLSGDKENAVTGMDAEYTWDDAYMGGSCVRVFGSTAQPEAILHLFKTSFALENGDKVTIRTKRRNGTGNVSLLLCPENDEKNPCQVAASDPDARTDYWEERTFTVGEDLPLAGKSVAAVALKVEGANNLDLLLGELRIERPGATDKTPLEPILEKTEALAFNRHGVDAKVVFHMPLEETDEHPAYNIDANTAMFRLWSQQAGSQPVMMGMTTSWAGLMFGAPVDATAKHAVRFGVSAVGLDMTAESAIAWGDWHYISEMYEVNDDISIDRTTLKPGEDFIVKYLDIRHAPALWEVLDSKGNVVLKAEDALRLNAAKGLPEEGIYDLRITCAGEARTLFGFIQVTGDQAGRLPEILSLKVNGDETEDVEINPGESIDFEYTGRPAVADVSRGVRITTGGVGFKFKDTEIKDSKTFAISFWFCPDDFTSQGTHLLNIRDKSDAWAKNTWGWFYHTLKEDGSFESFTLSGNEHSTTFYFDDDVKLHPGVWSHLTYVFERTKSSVRPSFYLNGVKCPIRYYVRNGKTIEKEAPYIPDIYKWREENVVAVGGSLHSGGSVRGRIDDLMVWSKALDEETVGDALVTPADAAAIDGLVSCWNFENEPSEAGSFLSEGAIQIQAGMHDYADTETEGQGLLVWQKPVLAPGSPFASGNAFTLTSAPQVYCPGAVVENLSGDDTAGSMRLTFPEDALYKVRLTVANELGESRPKIVTVRSGNAMVEKVETNRCGIKLVGAPTATRIDVETEGAGDYSVAIASADGRILFSRRFRTDCASRISLLPSLPAGLAVIALSDGTGATATSKVMVR